MSVSNNNSADPNHLISWNVNGLRAVLKKGFEDFIEEVAPDVICLQETKISDDLTGQFVFSEYPYTYWNCAEKKGYSGTAILSRIEPLSVRKGIGIEKHDHEGRVLTAEFQTYFLVTVYTPNSQNHDENKRPRRLDYRTLEWDPDFLAYLKSLEALKPVVLCGDLNVAHREIDLANPATNKKNAGFTNEERNCFEQLLQAGFIDTFRQLYPDRTGSYSWWSYRAASRERNIGWRIDYFCLSQSLGHRLSDAKLLSDVHGSDHCPISLTLG